MLRIIGRWALVLLVFSVANGVGLYALAPGGRYLDYQMEVVSHDWHQYLWAITTPNIWLQLFALSCFVGIGRAIVVVPVGLLIVGILLIGPSFRNSIASWKLSWLLIGAVVLGFLSGLIQTIVVGRSPGIP